MMTQEQHAYYVQLVTLGIPPMKAASLALGRDFALAA